MDRKRQVARTMVLMFIPLANLNISETRVKAIISTPLYEPSMRNPKEP